MMPLRKGQQVECIDGSFRAKERFWVKHLPVRGTIYTIRQIAPGYRGLGLRLEEIVNPTIPVIGLGDIEPIFLASRFRLVTPSKASFVAEAAAS
jgi:hypothetical protein